jgi:hypothetical protein
VGPTVDEAYQSLSAIRAQLDDALKSARSEQDARFKLINRILVEVLGWSHSLVDTERPIQSKDGFVDYSLRDLSGRTIAVIEAKRIGAIELDTATQHLTPVKVGGQVLKPALDGIQQAIRYAAQVGTAYAVVTDGVRWIFFRALRSDGIPPLEGKAFVFPSLAAVQEDFATFYELLAPTALSEQLHTARLNNLEGGHARPVEPRFFIKDPSDARLIPRSELGRDISELFKRFFAAMSSNDDEMRKACFVETRESQEAEIDLAKIAMHLANNIRTLDSTHAQELAVELQSVVNSGLSEICLIVGGKGAGKSTFLVRFFADVLDEETRESCVVCSVNVAEYPGGRETVDAWLAAKLRDEFERSLFATEQPTYDDYMGIFFATYQRWSTATFRHLYETDKNAFKIKFGEYVEDRREKAPYEYAVGMMRHSSLGRKKLPCVVFDNIDEQSFAVQEEVFRFASAQRESCPCFVLLTAADKAVWQLSKSKSIQSLFSKVFFLPTPAAREILAKRVGYIRAKLEDGEEKSGKYFSSRGLKISIKNVGAFAAVIEETLINHESVSGLLGRLSNFDIKRMLQLSERIISSPALNVDDLVRSFFDPKGLGPLDQRRVIEAAILGDYDRHNEIGNEFILNVFRTDGRYPYSPLLACSILTVLLAQRVSAADIDLAHMAVADLLNFFEACSVARDETRRCVAHLFESSLIAALDPTDELGDGTKVAVTAKGHAHLELASSDPTYIAYMALVTGLRYAQTRDTLQAHFASDHPKIEGARSTFASYLLTDDATKLRVPNVEGYTGLTKFRNEFAATWKAKASPG